MSKKFEFRLQKALDWYRQSLSAEKGKLQRIIAEIHELDRTLESVERRRLQEQARFQGGGEFLGRDFAGLTAYLGSIRDEILRIKATRVRAQTRMTEQRRQVASGHRRVRLLEQLEARRRSDWILETAVEEDAQASDLFLAAMVRNAAAEGGKA
jgi:hypothetical protein